MIVILGLYRRRPGTTWEQCSDHWKNVHGPLQRDTPGPRAALRRYVQHHVRPHPDADPDEPLAFDGFSESWWENIEARRGLWASPVWKELVISDERTFLDMAATRLMVLDHQSIVVGEPVSVDGQVVTVL